MAHAQHEDHSTSARETRAAITEHVSHGGAARFRQAEKALADFSALRPPRREIIDLTLHLVEAGFERAARDGAGAPHLFNLLARHYVRALRLAADENLVEPLDERLRRALSAARQFGDRVYVRLCGDYEAATGVTPDPEFHFTRAALERHAGGQPDETPPPPLMLLKRGNVRAEPTGTRPAAPFALRRPGPDTERFLQLHAREVEGPTEQAPAASGRLAAALRFSEQRSAGRDPLPHEKLHPRLPASYLPPAEGVDDEMPAGARLHTPPPANIRQTHAHA